MQNILGLLLSFIFIFIVIGIATVYAKIRKGASENTRKFIHIMVGNWIFITPMFTKLWALILVPLCFIIINLLSRKYKLFSAMEREDEDYGTVYYAISMLVLTTAAYLLRWPTLSFVGLLTMAYGDGFAAVVGIYKGRHYPFSFSPTKSLEGSITLACFSFVITFFSLFILQGSGSLRSISLWGILLISLLTSIFAAFIELTGLAGCDNLSVPIGSGLFSTLCLQFGNSIFYLFLLLYLVVLIAAFRWKAISADGIVAALLTGQTLYALGGMWIGLGLLAFFLLGSAASKLKNNNKLTAEQLQAGHVARNWKQVLSNSLPACILVWASYYFNNSSLILPRTNSFCSSDSRYFVFRAGNVIFRACFQYTKWKNHYQRTFRWCNMDWVGCRINWKCGIINFSNSFVWI